MLCNGLVLGWPIFLPLLMSDESPLPTGRITLDEASWMVSIPCFGTIFGSVFFACLTRNFGRKMPLFVVAIPFIVSLLLLVFFHDFYKLVLHVGLFLFTKYRFIRF